MTNSSKVRKHAFSSFPRRRESRKINHFWALAFAGVTALETFYEAIKNVLKKGKSIHPPFFKEG